MVNPRFQAIEESGKRASPKIISMTDQRKPSELFGSLVFNQAVMRQVLPKEVFRNVVNAMASKEKINPQYADTIAIAMKEWALSHGATHYTHWFQPLTGTSAEKHDAFLDWSGPDGVLEQLSGSQLIQGEPDASSFPSGGLRSTYEARGYTGWDPTSPVFLWKAAGGLTLCIPSVFFSWTGEVLDAKIPLLRSDKKINDATLRLLRLTGIAAERVYSTLGLEQEYFVIDRSLRNLRPDLLLLGKTVYGAEPPKGQELQDHYLGSVKDRILSYMLDFENEALKLAIPVKTRHNEVAPAQHEIAPVFEKASLAIDHGLLLMEIMRHVAVRHDLACLLHEKPFKGLNGSGKHSNWSLATDTGINLLDPSDTPGNNIHFLILLTAILNGVHRHAGLLRASIGSCSNDYRLGGHEAPPAIISIYLGEALELVLDSLEKTGSHTKNHAKTIYDLELLNLPDLKKDNTDRNRTSPFAFTGNKFEFRAVGSASNPAFPITVLNAAIAESLNEILDEIEKNLGKSKNLFEASIPVLQRFLKASKAIRFSGDNYSKEWQKEAEKRKLPNLASSTDAFEAYKLPSTAKVLKGILTKGEILSRYDVVQENYLLNLQIEVNLMIDIFDSQILPASLESQKDFAKALLKAREILGKKSPEQLKRFETLHHLIEDSIRAADALRKAKKTPKDLKDKMEALRNLVDQLEKVVDDRLWPLPKYRELLFVV